MVVSDFIQQFGKKKGFISARVNGNFLVVDVEDIDKIDNTWPDEYDGLIVAYQDGQTFDHCDGEDSCPEEIGCEMCDNV